MDWKILAAVAVVSATVVVFLDNYITDVYFRGRESTAVKLFYGLAFIVVGPALMLIAGIMNGFDFGALTPQMALWFFLSGAISSFSTIAYYKALELDESTNISIFYQLAPILYLIGDCLLFSKTFEPITLFGFAFIIAAPILIISCTRKKQRKKKIQAFIYAALYVLISVSGHFLFLSGSMAYNGNLDILPCMAIVIFAKGIANLVIVYILKPKWAKRFHEVVKSSKQKVYRPLFIYLIVYIIYDFAHRITLVTAPASAIASAAMDSTEPIVVFFMGIILTLICPKFGREKLDAKTIIVNLVATALVVAGIVLLQ